MVLFMDILGQKSGKQKSHLISQFIFFIPFWYIF